MEMIVQSVINTPRYKVDIVSQGEKVRTTENGQSVEGPYRPDRFIIRQWQPGLHREGVVLNSADASLNADAVVALRSACEQWLNAYATFQQFKGEDANRRLDSVGRGSLSGTTTSGRSSSEFGRTGTGSQNNEQSFTDRIRSDRAAA
jgi:hypothetical protein